MEKTKNYIKSKLMGFIKEVGVFQKEVRSNAEAVKVTSVFITEHAKKGEGGFEDVSDSLVKHISSHYHMVIMHQNLQHISNAIYEFYQMSVMLDLDLGLPEIDTTALNQMLAEGSPYVYTMEKGEVILVDTPIADSIKKGLDKKISSKEGLKALYDTFK